MKNKAMIVYETDKFHSTNDKIVIGVFTNMQLYRSFIYNLIKDEIDKNWKPEDKDFNQGYSKNGYLKMTIDYLKDNKQTQHLYDWELEVEEIELNKENIIISCVDNFDARMFIHLNYKNSYIIDLGNEKDFGQIFLSKYKELQNPIDFFGLENFQKQSEESNFSCENYEDQFEQQSHFINEAMALYGIELLKDFLLNDTINYNCIFVNLKEKITKKALKLCQ